MAESRRTSEAKRLRPFMATTASGVAAETSDQDILALVASLNTHKSSADHDERYYIVSEIDSLLGYKADKTLTLTAGNGLTGGGELSANRTFDVGAGAGITVDTDAVAVDKTANFDWTGNHTFNTDTYTKSLIPILSDLYDLGTYNKLYRKIWGSELSAIVFSQYEQTLLGGWLTISKGEGTFEAAVAAADTTINLGSNNFVTGDMVVVRGISANGSPQVEYMTVGTLVSGAIYNVTRNLDGTGANDWPDGTVYGNWGKAGNGRLELNAYDTPRFSVYAHGDTLAAINEQIRIGDLNGNWGYSSPVYGAAFGEYASGKPNLLIEPGVLRLRNYDQDVIKLTGTTASFENVITLGAAGRIQQGTGTWGTGSFTGAALWNENGVMNMGGWNAGLKQWWGGSDGKFHGAQGNLVIDLYGLKINTGFDEDVPTGHIRMTNSEDILNTFEGLDIWTYKMWGTGPTQLKTKIELYTTDYQAGSTANLLLKTRSGAGGIAASLLLSSGYSSSLAELIATNITLTGTLNVSGLITGTVTQAQNSDTLDGLHAATSGANAHVLATNSIGVLNVTGNIGAGTTGDAFPVAFSSNNAIATALQLMVGIHGDNSIVTHRYTFLQSVEPGSDYRSLVLQRDGGNVGIRTPYPTNGVLEVTGQVYFSANCSALSFTDRTPYYEGDALKEIKAIKGIDGKIDHKTLPAFVQVEREVIVEPAVEAKKAVKAVEATETREAILAQPAIKAKPAVTAIQQERDLGAMISMMTVGIQQLLGRLEKLENKEI